MKQDAIEIVKTYENGQFFQKQTAMRAGRLHTIPVRWPFAIWGVDIQGPFPMVLGGFKFLFVGIDMFTKWMEAEPVKNISMEVAMKFFKGIVYHFGVPSKVITDNGTQFTSRKWKRFCAEHQIEHVISSASHP